MQRSPFFALVIASIMLLASVHATEPEADAEITVLESKLILTKDWMNAGFKTPQATGETFLWATREGNVEMVLKCFSDSEDVNFTDEDRQRMQPAAAAATGYQPLAIRKIDDNRVQLKFTVPGWQDEPFMHEFTRVDNEWKLDTASSTRTANW
ncbi:MAG: hypothetical protein CMJ47_09215 [Planctomyces sp.]|nr:hypothetical protein [Planctomyces sp.]